jgi:hypothetical protein
VNWKGLVTAVSATAIPTASTATTGLLNSTDWNAFNGKQNTITNPITGTGTTNFITKFTASGTVGNSILSENGTSLGMNLSPTNGAQTENVEFVGGNTIASRSSVPQLYISSNAVGQAFSPTYKVNGFSTQYVMQGFDGTHRFFTASSGISGNAITFSERATILNNGLVGINQTTPTERLDVVGNGKFSGTVTALDFIGSSDIRLKENIKTLVPTKINSDYKTFNFIADDTKQTRTGVIAQELEIHHPEFVRTDAEGIKSVSYGDLHSGEIVYLKYENEELKDKVLLLKEKLEYIISKLNL